MRGDFTAPAQVAELYIDLLCRYNCTGVVEFLKTNENYRVDETLKVNHIVITTLQPCTHWLQVVRKYKILDATAYLLERVGEVKEAFELILQVWKREMRETNDRFSHTTTVTQG